MKNVFTPRPMFLSCSPQKLNSYPNRAKLYPLKRIIGSRKCNSKLCQVRNSITETDLFTCNNDQINFKIGLSVMKRALFIS